MSFSKQSLWQRFWRVAKPYWVSEERRGAYALLGVLLLLTIASSGLLVLETFPIGEIISALAAQDYPRLAQAVGFFIAIALLSIPIFALKSFVRDRLGLYWRRWLTHSFLAQYFHPQAFYPLHNDPAIDNPDQRISEDIRAVTQESLYFLIAMFDAVLQFAAFVGILWSISPTLMGVLLGYAGLSTWLTVSVFGPTLTTINFEQLKQEANFRFGLVRVRNHAEAIAFYRGQTRESMQSQQRFRHVFQNFNRLIRWQFRLNLFQNGYQYLTLLLPILVLAPRILANDLELGAVTQSQIAFERIGFTLGLVIHQFSQLSALAAGVDRLDTLQRVAQSAVSPEESRGSDRPSPETITFFEDSHLALQNLTLHTPNYLSTLVRQLSITVPVGSSLLITGASGVGKSSLLRAIAGLWKTGSGHITCPPYKTMLFLPQRPYVTLGSLREQLLYPNLTQDVADEQLLSVLQQVNLPHLAKQFSGLEAIEDWEQVLSEGEQQRLAFARLLLTQPRYALLDEATSALDISNEALLYQQLQQSGMTYISVGHRVSLLPYHDFVLELMPDQTWKLTPTEQSALHSNL